MSLDLAPAYLWRLAYPRGEGDLVPADLVGETGTIVGGGAVRVSLRLAKDPTAPRRVATARVRAMGRPAARAPASVLVEGLTGHDVRSAGALEACDLLAPLGPVPPAVERAAHELVAALRRALSDGGETAHVGAPGVLVCRCLSVGDRAVRRAVRRGARTVEDLGRQCAAGTGCHSCWPDLRSILDEETAAPPPREPDAAVGVAEAVAAVIRPLWRAMGVGLGRVRVEGPTVALEFAEIARDALASRLGAVALAQHALRECLAPEVRVLPLEDPAA